MSTMKDVTFQVPEKKDAAGKVVQKQLGPLTVQIPWGETAKESIEMFGDEVMNSHAFADVRVGVQGTGRNWLKKGIPPEEIAEKFKTYKPGVAMSAGKIDAQTAFKQMYANASPEERKKMIADLKSFAS